jgi:hypothetical protein
MGNEPNPATDPQEPETDPATEPPATEPPADPPPADPATDDGAGDGGDDNAAFTRIKAERDGMKKQLEEAQAKLAAVKTTEELETAKAALASEYEAKLLNSNIDVALVQAGCVNTKATKALIDTSKLKREGDTVTGLDVTKLAKDYPYLFAATQKVATGAASKGGGASSQAKTITEGVAAHYKKQKG